MPTAISTSHDPSPIYDRANAAFAAGAVVSGRSDAGVAAQRQVVQDQASAQAAARPKPSSVDTSIPDVMRSLSTVAAVNAALGSAPATLALMTDIAVASGSGTLSDEERQQLQAQYSELTQQVSSMVNSANAGAQSQSSSSGQKDDGKSASDRQDSPDAPSSTQDASAAGTTTTTTTNVVSVSNPSPSVSRQTRQIHVGADSYGPVTVQQTQVDRPAGFAQVEQVTTTQRARSEQVSRIAQMVQVSPPSQVSLVA